MEPEDTPPMSGSKCDVCVPPYWWKRVWLRHKKPITRLVLEAPGGLVHADVACRDGKVEGVHDPKRTVRLPIDWM